MRNSMLVNFLFTVLSRCDKIKENRQEEISKKIVGPTKILISSDILQTHDCSRYNWTMFDPEHKKERHEKVFPEDKKKAYALGEQMVTTLW